jgi:hypothetical protein
MNLETLNEKYMIRKFKSGKEEVVFRRLLEEKDAGVFRDLRLEDLPVHFPKVALETAGAPETPGAEGAVGANSVQELLSPSAGGTEPEKDAPSAEWKAAAWERVEKFARVDRLLAYATDTLNLTISGDAATLALPELKAKILKVIEQM